MSINNVPLLDLNAQYAPLKEGVLKAIEEVFDSKQFILGPKVKELESQIASYCNCNHAVGVSSGTDALVLALMALGIGEGDEVITSTFTFFATAGSIARVGATPVFVDIDPETYNIDTTQIEPAITSKTKAIIPVHLFGQMADMDPIMDIAKKHSLAVIEDSAQAIGSEYTSKDGTVYRAGSMGDVGCFSFFPSKNLGCMGDGGIITTNNADLNEKMVIMRVHGSKPKYYHKVIGGNFRLDNIQAAVLLQKLPLLEEQHRQRQNNAAVYDARLTDVQTPRVAEGRRMIYNQYTLQTSDRDGLMEELASKNIGHAIYYPIPLHLQDCFSQLGYKEGDLPVSEKAAKEVLSIPIYSELTDEQLHYVIDAVNTFTKKSKAVVA